MSDQYGSSSPPGGAPSAADDDARVRRGVQLGVLAYLLWGFLTIYWKQLSAFDAAELIAWRMACAGVVMGIVVTLRRSWPAIVAAFRDRRTLVRLIAASLLLTGNWGSYVWAVTNDRVIETALGYFIAPLATMAIGVFVLHETPTRAQRIAFALSIVAVVVLTVSYGRPPWIALALAGTWSLYGLAKRRVPLGPIDSLAGETFVLFVPAVVGLSWLSTRATSVVNTAAAGEWAYVLGTGVVTAVPLVLFAGAAQSIPFTLLGPLNLIVPIINFGLGWLLYDEPMPIDRVVGFAFVWVALVVVMIDRINGARRSAAQAAAAAAVV